jgi:DNA polymerase III alpha subunit (gram-positive type)
MNVLHIDFEATSKEAKLARPIEIGAMVTDENFKPIEGRSCSVLVKGEDYPPLSEEIIKVTGITQEELNHHGLLPLTAFIEVLGKLVDKDIGAVVAYNADYDKTVFIEEMFRQQYTMNPKMSWLMNVPWVCAMADIRKNYEFKSWRLAHVALEHGCTVCLKDLHRAINDVKLMVDMLQRSGETVHSMVAFKNIPWVYAKAVVAKPWEDKGVQSTIAKQAGFSWERAKGDYSDRVFPKQWVTRVKEDEYQKLLTIPLKVERITV